MLSRRFRRVFGCAVRRGAAVAAAAACGVGAPLVAPAVASALPAGCTQSGGTVTCKYTATGESQFATPAGVTSVTATAVGGQGGADFGLGEPGGLGAVATGTLSVTPGQVLFAEVGILGGAAGQLLPGFQDSGAGGGESDVRTCPTTGNQPCPAGTTLASRLLVAGGGGGRGDFGGAGGNAGTSNTGSGGNGSTGTGKNLGGGGGGGTPTAPGAGGAGCDGGGNGSPGAAGGGAGGAAGAANSQDGVSGGGGGAGWFGGGAGGGCGNANDAGGSGGGGSSHAATSVTGASFSQAASGQAPSVTIVYTVFALTTTTLSAGTVGQGYSTQLAAVNGTTPLTWSLAGGSLPDGLKLSSSGTISGTAQAAGTFPFAVEATDSSSPAKVATQDLSIMISQAATNTTLLADPSMATAGDTITLTATVSPTAGAGPSPTGTVDFDANGSAVCTSVAVSAGVAVCTTHLNVPGTYTLAASYSGDGNYTGSAGTVANYQVRKAGARPSLSVSPSSGATVDSPVTLTATVVANGTLSAPTGTVDFTVNGSTPSGCDAVPVASLAASCAVGPLPAGSYTMTATYSGDASYVATETAVFNYTVGRGAPTVTLSASPSSGADITSPVSLTATVSGATGGPAPGGTVGFTIDGSAVAGCGSVSVTSGTATCSVGALPPGSYALEASYSGDTNYLAGSDAIAGYQVAQASPGVSLSATPPSGAPTPSTPVMLSATVVPVAGGPDPTGTVTFLLDGSAPAGCSDVSVAAGTASCAVGTLSAGAHSLEATYSGDANYLTASDSIADYEVSKAVSAVGLSSNGVSSSVPAPVWGQAVSFVATITAEGVRVTSGTVQWSVDGLPVGAPVPVGADGTARFGPVTDLPVGSNRVTAAFSGTAQDAPAGGELDIVVGKAATSTTVTVTAATLTATVVAVPPGTGSPTGTVTFDVNGVAAGSAPVSPSGSATLANPSSGAETVSAAYGGDARFLASSGSNATANPTITAKVASGHPKTKYGWYRSPVRVSFTCLAGSAPLAGPCPGPTTVSRNGAAQSVSATIHATDGGIATAVVSPINIDQDLPKIRVTHAANGAAYDAPGPARLGCQASDRLSGLPGRCELAVRRGPAGISWRATATDRAGNVATARGSARLIDYYVAGVRKTGGFYRVKMGTVFTLVAFVRTATPPRLVFAAPLGVRPHPLGPPMISVGKGVWSIRVRVDSRLRGFRFWTLGVLAGWRLHTVNIEVRS